MKKGDRKFRRRVREHVSAHGMSYSKARSDLEAKSRRPPSSAISEVETPDFIAALAALPETEAGADASISEAAAALHDQFFAGQRALEASLAAMQPPNDPISKAMDRFRRQEELFGAALTNPFQKLMDRMRKQQEMYDAVVNNPVQKMVERMQKQLEMYDAVVNDPFQRMMDRMRKQEEILEAATDPYRKIRKHLDAMNGPTIE